MTEKRYEVETEGFQVSIKDNISKKYPFSVSCESIDDYENIINEAMSICSELNRLWEQTLRFEKYNSEKLESLGKIDNIITKTNIENHSECWTALRKIDAITNGYGD